MISHSLSSHTTISAELHRRVASTCKQVIHDNSEILAIRLGVNHTAVCAIDPFSPDDCVVADVSTSYCHAHFPSAY